MDDPPARYIAFFEGIAPHRLGALEKLFSTGALFRDPFNRLRGPAAIRAVFEHMFKT
ncbi:MAG: nuclear transport factor 2 family protein [Gammaproteobacteria bacterium]